MSICIGEREKRDARSLATGFGHPARVSEPLTILVSICANPSNPIGLRPWIGSSRFEHKILLLGRHLGDFPGWDILRKIGRIVRRTVDAEGSSWPASLSYGAPMHPFIDVLAI
jgi:hypothetical protein